MKSQVFVLVPYDVPPTEIGGFLQLLLERHRLDPDDSSSHGRYDYLVGALKQSFSDPVAEGRLPPTIRRAYAGNICERANLPSELVPAALVTPDGQWHDLVDFGWKMMREPSEANSAAFAQWTKLYRELIETHQNCWVIEIWSHS